MGREKRDRDRCCFFPSKPSFRLVLRAVFNRRNFIRPFGAAAPSPHGGSGARSPRTRPLTGLWLRQPSPRRAFRRPRAPRVRAVPLPARARQLRVCVGRSRRRRLRLSVTWRPRAAPPARGAPRLPDPCGGACVSCARLQACAWRCSRLDTAPVRALPSSVAVAAGNYWDLKTVGLCCRCSKTEH